MSATRAGYANAEQKRKLFLLMEERPMLCSGRYSAQFSKKDGQKEWEKISLILNAIPGGKKNWMQWRKTWQNMRSKTKYKQASIRRHAKGTGGGPPLHAKLAPEEEKILSLISEVAVKGHCSVTESVADFDFENAETSRDIATTSKTTVFNLQDHDYLGNTNLKVEHVTLEGTVITEDVADIKDPNAVNTVHGSSTNTQKKVPMKRKSAYQKMEAATSAAELLAKIAEEKLQVKRKYYQKKIEILEGAEKRKLKIMEDLVAIEKRKAIALEKLVLMKPAQ